MLSSGGICVRVRNFAGKELRRLTAKTNKLHSSQNKFGGNFLMDAKLNQRNAAILVITGIWSTVVGSVVGIATWYSLLSRYMYVEDLNQANSWGFDDYTLQVVSGETPFDLFSYFISLICLIMGIILLIAGLVWRRKIKSSR